MGARELLAALDQLHPLDRERVCRDLRLLQDAQTYDLLCELEARYAEVIDDSMIVAFCIRIVNEERELTQGPEADARMSSLPIGSTDRANEAARPEHVRASNYLTHTQEQDMPTTINELVESKYTKKEDVEDGKLVTFGAFKKTNVAMDSEPQRVRVVATFDELEKPVVLNMTNLKKMAKLFGSEKIDDWIGKRCVLFHDESVTYAGEEIGGIRVKAAPTSKTTWKSASDAAPEFDDDVPQ